MNKTQFYNQNNQLSPWEFSEPIPFSVQYLKSNTININNKKRSNTRQTEKNNNWAKDNAVHTEQQLENLANHIKIKQKQNFKFHQQNQNPCKDSKIFEKKDKFLDKQTALKRKQRKTSKVELKFVQFRLTNKRVRQEFIPQKNSFSCLNHENSKQTHQWSDSKFFEVVQKVSKESQKQENKKIKQIFYRSQNKFQFKNRHNFTHFNTIEPKKPFNQITMVYKQSNQYNKNKASFYQQVKNKSTILKKQIISDFRKSYCLQQGNQFGQVIWNSKQPKKNNRSMNILEQLDSSIRHKKQITQNISHQQLKTHLALKERNKTLYNELQKFNLFGLKNKKLKKLF